MLTYLRDSVILILAMTKPNRTNPSKNNNNNNKNRNQIIKQCGEMRAGTQVIMQAYQCQMENKIIIMSFL